MPSPAIEIDWIPSGISPTNFLLSHSPFTHLPVAASPIVYLLAHPHQSALRRNQLADSVQAGVLSIFTPDEFIDALTLSGFAKPATRLQEALCLAQATGRSKEAHSPEEEHPLTLPS